MERRFPVLTMSDHEPRGEHRLGDLAVQVGLISRQQLDRCLVHQSREGIPLGQILVAERLLNLQQLADIVELQARARSRQG